VGSGAAASCCRPLGPLQQAGSALCLQGHSAHRWAQVPWLYAVCLLYAACPNSKGAQRYSHGHDLVPHAVRCCAANPSLNPRLAARAAAPMPSCTCRHCICVR
jgi:hypothetical protein